MISNSHRPRTVRSKHSLGEANYHFQFTPKYRRDIFSDPLVKKACNASLRRVAERLGLRLYALEFGPDHCHLFVGNCKNYTVPELAHRFKGASSRELRRDHWGRVQCKLWGDSFWSAGYFYESIGRVTSDAIEYYITRQQGKHWAEEDYGVIARRGGQQKLDDFWS